MEAGEKGEHVKMTPQNRGENVNFSPQNSKETVKIITFISVFKRVAVN